MVSKTLPRCTPSKGETQPRKYRVHLMYQVNLFRPAQLFETGRGHESCIPADRQGVHESKQGLYRNDVWRQCRRKEYSRAATCS